MYSMMMGLYLGKYFLHPMKHPRSLTNDAVSILRGVSSSALPASVAGSLFAVMMVTDYVIGL
jgi:hypothetical protein